MLFLVFLSQSKADPFVSEIAFHVKALNMQAFPDT